MYVGFVQVCFFISESPKEEDLLPVFLDIKWVSSKCIRLIDNGIKTGGSIPMLGQSPRKTAHRLANICELDTYRGVNSCGHDKLLCSDQFQWSNTL